MGDAPYQAPQALRTAFPLSNSLIVMVKDTSLAANITVTEMFMATQKPWRTTTSRWRSYQSRRDLPDFPRC
ncbi:MAG: hypothetical protein ACLT74_05490 [Christensenellales bacterium]